MCSGCTVLPDSKVTELGSSNQDAIFPRAIFGGVDISEVPGCH